MLPHEPTLALASTLLCVGTSRRVANNIKSSSLRRSSPAFERAQSNKSLRIIGCSNDHSAPFLPFFAPGSISQSSSIKVDAVADRRTLGSMATMRFYSSTPRKGSNEVEPESHSNRTHGEDEGNADHHHSHGLFSGHSHSADHKGLAHALETKADRGSQITIVGLVANVGLTGSKAVAGWYMNSASLLADAGHSGSDLLGDFVTLFCWKLSRKSPTDSYPYGFAKFETIGTTTVSFLLIGAALGIGFHSYNLLLSHLSETVAVLPPGHAQSVLQNITQTAQDITHNVTSLGIGHSHGDQDLKLDPNAAWLAVISIAVKEWLYRITKKVADDEKSSVLLANALHHRSDAYSSIVTVVAIVGTAMFPAVPLDPIGGLLVSFVILRQGILLLAGAFRELTDAGVSKKTLRSLRRTLEPLLHHSAPAAVNGLLSIQEIRARRSGAVMFVDVVADVRADLLMHETSEIEELIRTSLTSAWREIYEVRIQFRAQDATKEAHVQ